MATEAQLNFKAAVELERTLPAARCACLLDRANLHRARKRRPKLTEEKLAATLISAWRQLWGE